MGWGRWFLPPRLSTPMGSGPSRLLQAFCRQLEFLHRSCFFNFVILTGQFSDIFSSAGFARQRRRALAEFPALSFPRHQLWLQQRLPTLQLSPPAPFFSEQSGRPLGMFTQLFACWKEIHFSPRWVTAVDLYEAIVLPSCRSSMDKVTASLPNSHRESA